MTEESSLPTPIKLHRGRRVKKIHVTQTEINASAIAESRKCMVAEAVKHCVPGAKNVSVDLATIRYTDKATGDRFVYMTPYTAQQAIVQFDQGVKPKPFDFSLSTLFQIRPRANIHNRTPQTVPTIGIEENPTEDGKHRLSAPVQIGGRAITRKTQDGKPVAGFIRRYGLRTLPPGLNWKPDNSETVIANQVQTSQA